MRALSEWDSARGSYDTWGRGLQVTANVTGLHDGSSQEQSTSSVSSECSARIPASTRNKMEKEAEKVRSGVTREGQQQSVDTRELHEPRRSKPAAKQRSRMQIVKEQIPQGCDPANLVGTVSGTSGMDKRNRPTFSTRKKKISVFGIREKKEGGGAVHSEKFQGRTQRAVPARLPPRVLGGKLGRGEAGTVRGNVHGHDQHSTQNTQNRLTRWTP